MTSAPEGTRDFEQRIYAALMSGQENGWSEFYDYYAPRLDAFLRKNNVYDEQDREDLLQETMTAIFESLARYDPDQAPFLNWVYGVARKIMLKRQEKYSELYDLEEVGEGALNQASLEAGDPVAIIPSGEADPRLILLREALTMMPESDQEILKMRSGRSATWEELSRELKISVSAAKMRHKRALVRLHELMKDRLGSR